MRWGNIVNLNAHKTGLYNCELIIYSYLDSSTAQSLNRFGIIQKVITNVKTYLYYIKNNQSENFLKVFRTYLYLMVMRSRAMKVGLKGVSLRV